MSIIAVADGFVIEASRRAGARARDGDTPHANISGRAMVMIDRRSVACGVKSRGACMFAAGLPIA